MPSTPLISPYTYFKTHDNPLAIGLLVFAVSLVGTILLVVANIQLVLAQTEDLPSEAVQVINSVLGMTVIALLFVAVFSLLLVAAIMHYGSGGSETDGTLLSAVGVAGWSYAPDLLALPIDYLLTRYYIRDMTFDGSDAQTFAAELEALDGTLGLLDGLLALGIVVWSVYILAKGTAGTHDLSVEDTIVPALVIGIGSLLFRLFL